MFSDREIQRERLTVITERTRQLVRKEWDNVWRKKEHPALREIVSDDRRVRVKPHRRRR